MPRSTRRVALDDSEQEDAPSQPSTLARGSTSAAQVKAEKANGRVREDEDDVQNNEEAVDGDEEGKSPRSHKRARANTAGDATTPPFRSQGENGDPEAGMTRAGVKTLPRDTKDGCVCLLCLMRDAGLTQRVAAMFPAPSSE